jgi:hypothetical protein
MSVFKRKSHACAGFDRMSRRAALKVGGASLLGLTAPRRGTGIRGRLDKAVRFGACRLFVIWSLAFGAFHASAAEPVLFKRDVMAALAKSNCNMGACHGNATGKGGFKLSLFGDDPNDDYTVLSRDQFGRRVNIVEPDQSLILLKPTNEIAHEGGKRFDRDSWEYRTLRAWIAGGMKRDPADAPKLLKIDVSPTQRRLIEPEKEVQLSVTATFSDGSTRDVTARAVYEPTSQLVEVSPDGKGRGVGYGEVTVMARYLHQQIPVRLAFVPARPDFVWKPARKFNYVDRRIFSKLHSLRMTASELCGDRTFLRRAYLDLLGLIPTSDEARTFMADTSPDKRAKLVDRLLERPEFADYWAMKWSDVLRNEEHALDKKGVQVFYDWIRRAIAEGKPLDEFARELIAARGSSYINAPANYYRAMRDPIMRAETTAQVFLGARLQCAKCHNHPFDRWTQDDYYGWASLFARVDYKVVANNRLLVGTDKHEWNGEQIVYLNRKGAVNDPRTGRPSKPRFLRAGAGDELGEDDDPLLALADWVASPDNPFFARAQVNRIWFHLMGRGLVDPVDDFRSTNLPSHPELLERLTVDFVEHGFDLRHVIRTVMNSRTYQLSSATDETNRYDAINYSHNVIRRIHAEPMLDGLSRVSGAPAQFKGRPEETRASQLPGVMPKSKSNRGRTEVNQFLDVFGKTARLVPSECDRSNEPTMSQAFQMISGPTVNEMIEAKENRLTSLLASKLPDGEIIDELYWTAITRPPGEEELASHGSHVRNSATRRAGFEDVLWSLLNSKEFVFRY